MLIGKVALITGGARGIGAGIARVMAAQGARVALLDLDRVEAEKTAAGLATPGLALACDVAIEADVAAAVRTVVEALGALDILVNNAGAGRGPVDASSPRPAAGTVDNMSAAAWDQYLAQNHRTTFAANTTAAPPPNAPG